MAFKLSNRSDIESFRAVHMIGAVKERMARGEDIIQLSPGQPCFGAPEPVLAYAQEMLKRDPQQGYTAAVGMMDLREKIAAYYSDSYGCNIGSNRIIVTTGSSGGFIYAFLAAFDAGDTVAMTTPTYPAYRNFLKALNINIVEIETTAQTNYQPTAELLEEFGKKSGKKFDGLIINSPSNPTGAMIDAAELKKICEWCDNKGVRLISDEAYHRITYGTSAETAVRFSKNVIALNTFSKYFAMTGWRLGWMVVPVEMAERVKKLAEHLFVSPPTMSQYMAIKVFDHLDVCDGYVQQYKQNREILVKGLPEAGITRLSQANGAFYLYADIHNLTNNSEEFCRRMLDEAKVAMTPGVDFDLTRGHTTIRIAYAGSPADMQEGVARLKRWLAKAA